MGEWREGALAHNNHFRDTVFVKGKIASKPCAYFSASLGGDDRFKSAAQGKVTIGAFNKLYPLQGELAAAQLPGMADAPLVVFFLVFDHVSEDLLFCRIDPPRIIALSHCHTSADWQGGRQQCKIALHLYPRKLAIRCR